MEDVRQDLARLALIALYPLRMADHLTRPPHLHLHSHPQSPEREKRER